MTWRDVCGWKVWRIVSRCVSRCVSHAVARQVFEKVMAENFRDLFQKHHVDVVSLENAVDVAAVAMQLLGKPFDGVLFGLGVEHFLYAFADM